MEKEKTKKPLWMRLLICAGALGAVLLVFLLIEKGIDKSGAVEKAEAKQEERVAKREEKNAMDAVVTDMPATRVFETSPSATRMMAREPSASLGPSVMPS